MHVTQVAWVGILELWTQSLDLLEQALGLRVTVAARGLTVRFVDSFTKGFHARDFAFAENYSEALVTLTRIEADEIVYYRVLRAHVMTQWQSMRA